MRAARFTGPAGLLLTVGCLSWACGRIKPAHTPTDAAATDGVADAAETADGSDAETPFTPPPALPTIPIGMEAFRQWDRLPGLRLGTRTVMQSTFDRSGGNEAADASHFLREAPDGTFVALDLQGPGVLAFVRTNHWHGSPWHYVIDARDEVVSESSTADPSSPVAGATFLPADLFPSPLAETWAKTR